jgi:hypothetical protein
MLLCANRFFRIYPLLNLHQEGVDQLCLYLRAQVLQELFECLWRAGGWVWQTGRGAGGQRRGAGDCLWSVLCLGRGMLGATINSSWGC